MKKVIYKILIDNNLNIILELCCPYCLCENKHSNHKTLKIDDEDALKKENITIENSNKEFDSNVQKLNNLKNLIEHEMEEIDKTFEKVDKETTESFKIKIEKIKKEEDDLKEKLKTEVTKIKEQLDIFLSDVNSLIKATEKIEKGIKALEKEEKIMIKTLSYVSKINKNKREIGKLFQQLMKNIKISFIENENKIKYEDYYFNGIPLPKDIEFKDIGTNSFNVLWKIDDINILNIDKNEIKYRLEIRKENSKDDFIQIYEGNENNFIVNNKLEKNTNYEIRICSVYKDIISDWTKNHKIKTKNFDSIILNEIEKGNEYLEKLYEWTGYNKMELLYRGTRDGSGSNMFHNKCDNQGPTICLFKNEKGNIFGGYSSISWTSNSSYQNANGSFLFTLTNIHNTAPTKFQIYQNSGNAVYHNSSYGPTFGGGHDIYISSDCLNNKSSYSCIGYTYQDVLGKGKSIFTGDANNNNINMKLSELEVFKLYK